MSALRTVPSVILLLSALSARAGEPPAQPPAAGGLEFQAVLYRTDAKTFLDALRTEEGAAIPAVFDRASSRDLSSALADATRLTARTASAPPGRPAVLEAVEQKRIVRDAQIEIQGGQASAEPVESLIQWGFKVEVTPLAAADGRLTARIDFQFAGPLEGGFLDHMGVRVDLPRLSAFKGKALAVFPPGGSLAFGCVASQDPETLLLLVLALSPDTPAAEVPGGRPELAGLPVFSTTTWLLLHDRAALARAAAGAKGAELAPDAASKLLLAGTLQALAFLPQAPADASELGSSGQESFVRGWEKDEAGGVAAFSPVIGVMETGLRWTGGEAARREGEDGFDVPFAFSALVLRRPVRSKTVEKTRLAFLVPEVLKGIAQGTLSTGVTERCFFFKAASPSCPYAGTVLASVKPAGE